MTKPQLTFHDDIDCAACRAQLPDYVRRELAGADVLALFPAVTRHLATCPDCEAAYFQLFHAEGMQRSLAELAALGDRADIGARFDATLAALPPVHEYDERPLAQGRAQGRAWFDRATAQLRLVEIHLLGLFGGQSQAPVLAGLQGAPAGADTGADTLSVPITTIAAGELEVALHVLPDPAGDPARCRIEVAVSREGHFGEGELGSVLLTLAHAGGEQTAAADELGQVVFDGVPRAQAQSLVLTVNLPED